jgi:uncharacterized membrane protein YdjX (TVP38/TMEM64 family)
MKISPFFRLLVLLTLAAAIGIALLFLPVQDWVSRFLEWVQELGAWGPVVLGAAYIPAAVLLIPGSLLTLGGGFAFGVWRATIAVSLGSTLGAAAAFLVGRTLARGWIEEKIARHPKFRAIDQAVAEQGFKIVLLTRLSPVFPFTFLNYAYGLTKVRFRDYLLASWIGMLPGTLMYVYLGSAVQNLAELAAGKEERTLGEKVLFFAGLAATVIVTVFVTRVAKKALEQTVPGVAGKEETLHGRVAQG